MDVRIHMDANPAYFELPLQSWAKAAVLPPIPKNSKNPQRAKSTSYKEVKSKKFQKVDM